MLRLLFLLVLFVTMVVLSPLPSEAVSFTFRGFWGSNASCGATDLGSTIAELRNIFDGCESEERKEDPRFVNESLTLLPITDPMNIQIPPPDMLNPFPRGSFARFDICDIIERDNNGGDCRSVIPADFILEFMDFEYPNAEDFPGIVFSAFGPSGRATLTLLDANGDPVFNDDGKPVAYTFIVGQSASASVPEPGTWLLMGTGLIGLLAYVRRKRSQTR